MHDTSPRLRTASMRPCAASGPRNRFALVAFATTALLIPISGCAILNASASTPPESSPASSATADPEEPTADPEESTPDQEEPTADSESPPAGAGTPGTAQAMLAELEVKGRAPKTGYDPDLFDWRSDVDHNGCDTRNDVLRRDLDAITLKRDGCVVTAGTLDDEYAGRTYAFDRSPNNIDVDHIVARSNAWQTGAFALDDDKLREFGNDPLNLIAVSSSLNRQKGDSDAATWLPPAKDYRCEYVSRQIAVKHKYELWVVQAEKAAMEQVLDTCPGKSAFDEDVSWPGRGEGDKAPEEPNADSG
ncbi:DUF1524 domain-containing protein, partial [Brevibacterium sp.]|uniref:HNH endonuclease family protein n=1 Tax=Brevibacterium sp. TaxID=1701 RepID=UPI0028123D1C